jgi:protein phosphatase
MGGAAGGELASRLATDCIYEALATPDETGSATRHQTAPQFAQHLRRAVEFANSQLYRTAERDPRLFGMGTTATVARVLGDTLYLAQIGDSRAYLVRQGTAHQLTHDQSRVQALVDAGVLTPEEAARSGERNIILQALGPEPKVDVDLTRQQLRRGDVVVLTTDGLHGLVSPAEIAALAAPHQTGTGAAHPPAAPPDPAAACQALVDLGNNRGGPDNITVVIMHLDGDDLAEPRQDDVVRRQQVP